MEAIYNLLAAVVATVAQTILPSVQQMEPNPHQTPILTGQRWVQELLDGHPERIRNVLGVHKSVFRILLAELQAAGYRSTRRVTVEEQLAIFLYSCVTGVAIPHIGERFRRSNETISECFKLMLGAFSSGQIYSKYVRVPSTGDPTPIAIADDPRFWPYFKDAVGAMDCTHIPCLSSAADFMSVMSQNCLVCCDFDMKFTYVLSGWEGSATNPTSDHNVPLNEISIPSSKYYLAGPGFPICSKLFVPYPGERYHLDEWGTDSAQIRPANQRELFNLRHAQLHNVVDRAINVLVNRRFRILRVPPEYDMDTQSLIPIACCCIHNIIRTYDSAELEDMENPTEPLDDESSTSSEEN